MTKKATDTMSVLPTSIGRLIGVLVGAVTISTIVLLAFVWPAVSPSLRYFPIAIVGPEHTEQMPYMLMFADKDQFRLSVASSRSDAVHMIETREVYGVVVLGSQPEVISASANGDVPSQIMHSVADGLRERRADNLAQNSQHQAKAVIEKDHIARRQSTFDLALLSVPLVIVSIIGAVVSSLFIDSGRKRLIALLCYALGMAVSMTIVLSLWLNVLPGRPLELAVALTLGLFSMSSVIAGLYSVVGPAGIGGGVVYTLLIANPIAGLLVISELLPEPLAFVGTFLAPSAFASLLRTVTYFPGAEWLHSAMILTAWSIMGGILIIIGAHGAILSRTKR